MSRDVGFIDRIQRAQFPGSFEPYNVISLADNSLPWQRAAIAGAARSVVFEPSTVSDFVELEPKSDADEGHNNMIRKLYDFLMTKDGKQLPISDASIHFVEEKLASIEQRRREYRPSVKVLSLHELGQSSVNADNSDDAKINDALYYLATFDDALDQSILILHDYFDFPSLYGVLSAASRIGSNAIVADKHGNVCLVIPKGETKVLLNSSEAPGKAHVSLFPVHGPATINTHGLNNNVRNLVLDFTGYLVIKEGVTGSTFSVETDLPVGVYINMGNAV